MPLKQYLFFLIFLFSSHYFYSQSSVSGTVFNENQFALSGVLVVNINTDEKTVSDEFGNFKINANEKDELRFVRVNYDRASVKITSANFIFSVKIFMSYTPELIETVDLSFVPSGDLSKDSKKLNRVDKVAQLEQDIGLPKSPEKPREKPADLKKSVLLPILFGNLNVQGIYDLASGKARRQKRLYKYQDFQEKIEWIKTNLKEDFFKENNIPENQISDFLGFAINTNSSVVSGFKQKNIDKVSFALIQVATEYLKKNKKQ
ncbi:carboxypeptidase-like regulatory domain-containing protein [Halpernia sp.]|uniref:carboxypeptidase-like regulatory domain-containing protein n=1 Tax=Halpernia sp. TaxID=2782209 RepID=UPI003A8E2A7D